MRRFIFFIYQVLCASPLLFAQANIWYFGDYAGIEFDGTNAPKALSNSGMKASEGSAVVTDFNGSLLFYTDGISVWNSKHKKEFTGMKGSGSSTQTALIIPIPGTNCTKYFIFTVGGVEDFSAGANLTMVQVSGDPLTTGTTITKTEGPTRLFSNSCTEKLNAVKDGNGGYWVVTHEWKNNTFHTFHVSNSTTDITKLKATIVTTAIGKDHTGILTNGQGQLKFNRKGTQFALAVAQDRFVEIFDFNLSSGKPSNPMLIQSNDPSFPNFKTIFSGTANIYGLEYSNSGKYLYVAEFFTGGNASVYQFDLSAGNLDAIRKSNTILATNSHSSRYPYGAMQMGPDGKIYIATTNRKSLAVINLPELKGSASKFIENGVTLSKDCMLGLPTTIVVDLCCPNLKPYLGPDTTLCLGQQLDLSDTNKNIKHHIWSNTDTTSSISISKSGQYWVEIEINGCTARDTINVNFVKAPVHLLGKDTVSCTFTNFILGSQLGGNKYLWNTKATTKTISVNQSGTYWVMVDSLGCKVYDTIIVNISDLQKPNLGKDTTLCEGEKLNINGFTPNAKYYQWSSTNNLPDEVITKSGDYILNVSDDHCRLADTISVLFLSSPLVDLGKDTSFCGSINKTLDLGNPGMKYLWHDGSTNPTFVITGSGQYWAKVTNSIGCSTSDTIVISDSTFVFTLGRDTTLCMGQTLNLSAKDNTFNQLWSSGETGPNKLVTKSGKYFVTVSNGSCSVSDTILVNYFPQINIKLGKDTSLCEDLGESILLTGPLGYKKYLWKPGGETIPNITVLKEGLYTLTVYDANNCEASDSININKLCPLYLWVPTAFNPGSDGANSKFKVNYIGPPVNCFEIQIFSRWGELLFKSNDINAYWDGTYMGKPCQLGMYLVTINMSSQTITDIKRNTYKGMLYLNR